MFPILSLLPRPSPSHPSGSSQCTSPKHPVSCIEPGLVIHFIYDIIHVSMPFSQIIPPSPSPTESKRLFYTSVSLLLSLIQGYRCHLSKFHIYALAYCIGVFLSGLLHSVLSAPLQYSCPENPMNRGAWWATVHGVAKSHMTELSTTHSTFFFFLLYSIVLVLPYINMNPPQVYMCSPS